MSGANILFIVTGSIAAAKACEVVSQLVQQGHRVRPVATASALHFVGPAMLEGLTGQTVAIDAFAPGGALDHIALTRWADVVLVCPATANTINGFAAGRADDLAGALFLAHDRSKPWLIAPAMNPAMWSHPATTEAVRRLQAWGINILPVGNGRTACGEDGAGRLLEPEQIVAAVEATMRRTERRRRILVTAGGTFEPIDGVRGLSNTSTGATGAGIAAHFRRAGHDVVFLHGRGAVQPAEPGAAEEFVTFADLDAALGRWLGTTPFDAIIHAAAVSDFGVAAIEVDGREQPPAATKLDSAKSIRLRLATHPKLVDGLRARSCRADLRVVAFKLTRGADRTTALHAVTGLLRRAQPDWVVHNDLGARSAGGPFPAEIFRPDGSTAAHCPDRAALAAALEQLLAGPTTPS